MIVPSKRVFLETRERSMIPPLHREIPYSSPYVMYEAIASPNSLLLESIKGPPKIARYSFIGFDPCATFRTKNSFIEMSLAGKGETLFSNKPLNVLRSLINGYKQMPCDNLPPFQGGLMGFFAYDFVQYLERLPQKAVDDLNLPDAHFLMFDKIIAFDHLEKKCWIIVCPGVEDFLKDKDSERDWPEIYDEAAEKMHDAVYKLRDAKFRTGESLIRDCASYAGHPPALINYEMQRAKYIEMVKRAKEYIAAGDIFQANLSQRVSAHISCRVPWDLYKALRVINPSPFAAFMNFENYQIVSSSPERLVRINHGTVETRPIAGTRPRGRDNEEDEMMREELLLNEKERAEHIMLIDLERNDLGRVSDYGSVKVDELMITEDCSHVIHIVSNVAGNLASGRDFVDVIKAAFPGGTITGVPKVRCMEIIDELEPVRRGPYTGSIGYIGFSGDMDLNIIIRSFVVKSHTAYVQAGAGIVADSNPDREYLETLKKAEALIRTLAMIRS